MSPFASLFSTALLTLALAASALTVGDGEGARPACTSFTYDRAADALALSPRGCLGPVPGPVGDTPANYEAFVNASYLQEVGHVADPPGLTSWALYLFNRAAKGGLEQGKGDFLGWLHGTQEAINWRAKSAEPAVGGGVTAAQLFLPGNNYCHLNPLLRTIGPGPCGSQAVPVGNCSSGMPGAITRAWQLNLLGEYVTFRRQSLHVTMTKGQALSFKFRTGARPLDCNPPNGCTGGFGAAGTTQGAEAPTFISVSKARCDFDYAKVNTANACYRSIGGGGNGVDTRFSPAGTPADWTQCELEPNTDYFVNFRWEQAVGASRGVEACNPSGVYTTCGMVVDFR